MGLNDYPVGIQIGRFKSDSVGVQPNNMSGIEVLELSIDEQTVALIKTTVKEKQHIADTIKNYGARLQGFIRKRVRNSEDAEDILQEVYYQLADADRLLKPIDQMAAWLFTVARNRIPISTAKRRLNRCLSFLLKRKMKVRLKNCGI